ncbi:uncharacterized protein B0H64DRAFT_404510 [Chaetomium fimeti]|uniref:Uncharacterized protein n=1 Tax=Chaetomium fimeti TaxID=1854472 RepID=A0AAE0HBD6_9PEZI|nr:hypothetical protein B0H64DRAFT_404510 [Chaetomium fimeti]
MLYYYCIHPTQHHSDKLYQAFCRTHLELFQHQQTNKQTHASNPLLLNTMKSFVSRPSAESQSPPRYTPQQQDVELARLNSASPSVLSAPPPYGDEENPPPSSGTFHPTVHFQIQTTGKQWMSMPFAPKPEPIPVFALDPTDTVYTTAAGTTTPQFTSTRPERSSGSCYLTTTNPEGTTASTTTYRFGPGRPPLVRLFSPHHHSAPLDPTTRARLLFSKDAATDDDNAGAWDAFPVTSVGLLTRAVAFRSRLGSFQWRYASRRERHAAAKGLEGGGVGEVEVSSLLVLERVVKVAQDVSSSSSKGKGEEEVRTVVAHFARGEGLRTPGSGASSAGNGGRLVMDLGVWEGVDGKGEREMALLMVVTTCLVMLKREVDRRRAQQIAIMAGAAGGGS